MGDPMTYVSAEPVTESDRDEVFDALADWKSSWASITTHEETVGSQKHGMDVELAREVLDGLGGALDRALVVTVYDDGSGAGTGRFYVRQDEELLHVDSVEGGENGGVDIVDYYRRRYGFDGIGWNG